MDQRIRAIAEQCSQGKTGVNELDLLHLRPYVEGFLDPHWLSERLNEYEAWASANSDPFLQRSLLHRPLGMNMLVASIWAARSWENIYIEDPSFWPPGGAKRLINIACSLAVLELHAGTMLDSSALEHLRQRLQASDQLWGIIHECGLFAHLINRGAEVEPRFLRKADPMDIIVRWRGQQVPVQCKSKRPGAGRVISQDVCTRLAGSVARDLKVAGRRMLVRIGSTGTIRDTDIDFLRDQIRRGAGSAMGPEMVPHQGRVFTVKTLPLSGSFTAEQARSYLRSFDFHLGMVIGEPRAGTVGYEANLMVGIDARPNETRRVWRSLRDSIVFAARQLEGGPPGIVAVHYADPIPEFEALRPGDAHMLQEIARIVHTLPHVAAVMLSCEPDLQLPGARGAGTVRAYVDGSRLPADFPMGRPVR